MIEHNQGKSQVLGQWVRATWAGWVLGIPLIIALALVGEADGIGGAQVLIGVGMGAGMGLMQRRAIRDVLHSSAPWLWSCVVGLGLPFLATDIAKAAGWNFPYSLFICVALGGLIVGVWQAFLLRPHVQNAGLWVVGSVAGWTMSSGMAAGADTLSRSHSIRGIWGALAYLGIVAGGGGLILGLITGISLVRMLRHKPAV